MCLKQILPCPPLPRTIEGAVCLHYVCVCWRKAPFCMQFLYCFFRRLWQTVLYFVNVLLVCDTNPFWWQFSCTTFLYKYCIKLFFSLYSDLKKHGGFVQWKIKTHEYKVCVLPYDLKKFRYNVGKIERFHRRGLIILFLP